jgi:hypothetical protein
MLGTELPNEVLLPGKRVAGTEGPIGSAVKDYRELDQRLLWIEGVIETHLNDMSLKTSVYTPEEEEGIILGTWT